MKTGVVSEIYATVQGEGPYAGERQLFVRLAGCPLRCRYCDTPGSLTVDGHPDFEAERLAGDILRRAVDSGIDTVTFTGGEPLVQAPFLSVVFPILKEAKLRIYLETAGVHPELLRRVVGWCDVISMDMKMPSATGRSFWAAHEAFLSIAAGKAFVKVVCDDATADAEFARAVEIAAAANPRPTFVIQPVTPPSPEIHPVSPERIDLYAALARTRLANVLVLPQQHPAWGVR